MRYLLLLLLSSVAMAQTVVPEGTTFQFNQANATWTLSTGSVGSITSGGLYTAPTHVSVPHPIKGVQTLPTDHIYFQNVTNLPLIPNEAAIMNQILHTAPYPGSFMSLAPSMHMDYTDNTFGTFPMVWGFTGAAGSVLNFNGNYQWQTGTGVPYIGVPNQFIQSGIYQCQFSCGDRHIFSVNRQTGIVYEGYKTSATGTDPCCVATANGESGSFYGLNSPPAGNGSSGTLPPSSISSAYSLGPGSVAGGQLVGSMIITAEEIRAGSINHVGAFTMPNGAIAGGTKCGPPPALVYCIIWPATNRAFQGGDLIPYGAIFRLKSTVDTVNNAATGLPYSPEAQTIFTAWKTYGVMLTDGGSTGQQEADVDIFEDFGMSGGGGLQLASEIANSKVAADGLKVGDWNHWDIVDPSSLMPSTGSTFWPNNINLSGQTNQSSPYISTTYATAIATDNSSHVQTLYQIVLQGVTVGVPWSVETIQAGVSPIQLQSWVNGTSNQSVTWTMSPTVGTLTPGGLYTPPSTVAAPTYTLLTVTSVADTQASTTVRVAVFPAGGIYMLMGPSGKPYQAVPYTDSQGHVWQTTYTGRVVGSGAISQNNYLQFGSPQNCAQNANWCQWPTTGVTAGSDWKIWQWHQGNFGGDFYFRMHVPNGTYNITLNNGLGGINGTVPVHTWEAQLESMGTVVNSDYDLSTAGGGATGVPLSYTMQAVVTNGVLTFAERQVPHGGKVSLSSFSIVAAPGSSGSCPVTQNGITLNPKLNPVTGRTAAITPFLVYYDATNTTDANLSGTGTANTFQHIHYAVNWGDGDYSGTTNWPYGANPARNSKNLSFGPIGSHLYVNTSPNDATRVPQIWAVDSGGAYATCSLPPVTVYAMFGGNGYTGAGVTCVANTTPTPGAGGCPAGAATLTTSNLSTATSGIAANSATLFHCGDTFSGTGIVAASHVRLDAYGSPNCQNVTGNLPIFNSGSQLQINQGTDVVVSNMAFQSSGIGTAIAMGTNVAHPAMVNGVVYNVSATGYTVGYTAGLCIECGVVQMNVPSTTSTNFFSSGQTCVNGSGAYNCGNTGTSPFTACDANASQYYNSMYTSVLGSFFGGPGSAGTSGIDTARSAGGCQRIFSNNTFTAAANAANVLKVYCQSTFTAQAQFLGDPCNYNVIYANLFSGNSGPQLVEFAPQGASYDERESFGLIEANIYQSSSAAATTAQFVDADNVSVRNNIFDNTPVTGTGGKYCNRGVTGTTTQASSPWPNFGEWVNNTSIFGSITLAGGGACGTNGANNTLVQNNLFYQGGGTAVNGNGTGNTLSNNSASSTTNPSFGNKSGAWKFVTDYNPTSTVATSGASATAPNMFDGCANGGFYWKGGFQLGALSPVCP